GACGGSTGRGVTTGSWLPAKITPRETSSRACDQPEATTGSAGIDLVNQENMDITLPGEVLLMPSQIQGPLPEGMVGLVLPRSSASKQGLFVVPGVVDSDYGGVIHVQLWSHLPKQLFQGDAWAQLILVPYSLPAGGRNVPRTGGFGSTGHSNSY
uniref:dUTPase-like domain-containing protein n=1 Tax=Terrapene triunguis TaxID=2587831 RepID=A0A674HUD6_9SAUR